MTRYLDAAVIVAALSQEPLSEKARRIMAEGASNVASTWGMVEAASGLAKKVRTKEMSEAEFELALRQLDSLGSDHLPLVSLNNEHMRVAMTYCVRAGLGLRAGDALHVAIAASLSATLVTSDIVMLNAAEVLGLSTQPLS